MLRFDSVIAPGHLELLLHLETLQSFFCSKSRGH